MQQQQGGNQQQQQQAHQQQSSGGGGATISSTPTNSSGGRGMVNGSSSSSAGGGGVIKLEGVNATRIPQAALTTTGHVPPPPASAATMLVNSLPAGIAQQQQQFITVSTNTVGVGGAHQQNLVSTASNTNSGGSSSPSTPSAAAHFISSGGAAVAAAAATPTAVAVLASAGAAASAAFTNSELLSAFECPVCMDYMVPPYLQCPAGHLVCGGCRPKLSHCPTCRGPIPTIRNLAMEKVANSVMFPCKFSHAGCTSILVHQEKLEHEETCEFRPYNCPCPGATCKWQGNLTSVMNHLMKMHKSITTLQGEDIVFLATDINLPGAVDWVMLQACFNSYFMLVLEKQDKQDQSCQSYQMYYAVVQLIGTKKEAEQFVYRLELNSNRRRLCWEATPRSINESVATAIAQSDCLAFDANQAQLFAENGNLGINVTISLANCVVPGGVPIVPAAMSDK